MNFSEQLIRWSSNTEEDFNSFVTEFHPLLYAVLSRRFSNFDINELLQETYVKIYNKKLLSRFNGDSSGQFKAYLIKIAINTSLDFVKKENRVNDPMVFIDFSSQGHCELFGVEETSDHSDKLIEDLYHAIDKLQNNYKEVIKYRLLGYTNKKISQLIQKPIGTINAWSTRALRELKHHLEKSEYKSELFQSKV